MIIPRDFIDELLGRVDIAEVVGESVRLKKTGRNMVGLCPFHTEKTPSFSVNPEMQIYKCFGCGKGGNVITYIMETENLPFTEAVEVLAKKAGMTVPQEEGRVEYTTRKKRILELNRDAAKFFYKTLSGPHGQAAREYLARRGVTKASVTKFGLGAAPDNWSMLIDAMMSSGYTKQELLDAGLARQKNTQNAEVKKSSGMYDFFRNRLMFPVIDVRGEVVAFSGRALSDDDKGPKYLNSPDTIAFSKSKTLFALNLAKKSKAQMMILVEGNFDVVMLHQAGFDSAVAQLGSAFTSDHARLLAKYTDEVILAFDADEAGKKATLKTLPLMEETGKRVRVIDFGQGDPDEYIRKNGADAFANLIERSENRSAYRLQTIQKKFDMSADAGRLSYLTEATQYLAQIPSKVEREIYAETVAKTAGVSLDAVLNELKIAIKKKIARDKNNPRNASNRPKESVQPESRALRYKNEASAVAEEGIIRCLMKDQTLMKTVYDTGFTVEEFTADLPAKIFAAIESRLSGGREVTQALIMSDLSPDEASHLTTIIDKPEAISVGTKAITAYIDKVRKEGLRSKPADEDMLLKIAEIKKKEMTD